MALNQMKATLLRPVLALTRICRFADAGRLRRRQRSAEQPIRAGTRDTGPFVCASSVDDGLHGYAGDVDDQRRRSSLPGVFEQWHRTAGHAGGERLDRGVAAQQRRREYDRRHHHSRQHRADCHIDHYRQSCADLQHDDHHSSKNDVRHEHGVFRRYCNRCGSGYGTRRRRHSESSGQIRCRDWRVRDPDQQSSCAARPDVDGRDG